MEEARETVTADNELGELGSFLNGGSGGGGGRGGSGAGWDQELGAGGGAKGGRGVEGADEDEVSVFVCEWRACFAVFRPACIVSSRFSSRSWRVLLPNPRATTRAPPRGVSPCSRGMRDVEAEVRFVRGSVRFTPTRSVTVFSRHARCRG